MESQFIFCTKKRKRSDAVLINQQRHNGKYKANHCRNISLDSITHLSKKTFKFNLSHPPNRGEKGLSAGDGVEADVGDEAVAGVGMGMEAYWRHP